MGAYAAEPEPLAPREDTTYFPAWSSDGTSLAYSSNRTGDWEIYRRRMPDGAEQRLTFDSGTDLGVSWHPSGERVAFWSNRTTKAQLHELDLSNLRVRVISASKSNDRWPAWSPDGRELAFVSDRAGQNDVYVMSADGRSARRITQGLEGPFRPQWSRDGKRLVFAATSAGNVEIFSVDLGDLSVTNESKTPAVHEGNPAYSPDGRFIAYDAHSEGSEDSGDGKWELWQLDTAKGERRRLTRNDVDDWCPVWHPSGKQIAYLSGIANANYKVRILDAPF